MKRAAGNVNSAYSSTLGNGIRVLELLRTESDGLGVNAIAAALNMHRTVVYRLTGTLRAHKLLVQGPDGRYRLGVGLFELAGSVRAGLRDIAGQYLGELAERVSATAFLTVADGEHAVSACVVEPRSAHLHVSYRIGIRHPLDVSAAGVAILAARPATAGERPAVSAARALGYAVTSGELEPGAWGLAVAIPAPSGFPGASIGVVALTERDAESTANVVRATVSAISAASHS